MSEDKELAADLERVRQKIKQTRAQLNALEMRLYAAFEEWLERLEKQK